MPVTPYLRRMILGGGADTTIVGQMNPADMSFTLTSHTGWPDGSTGNWWCEVEPNTTNAEKILCGLQAGGGVTVVVRNGDGGNGTGLTHVAGSSVRLIGTAQDLDEANQLVHALLTGGTTGQVATVDTSLTPPIKLAALPAAGVSSFNGGTGAIAQANGYGIAGANANPPVPAVALTTVQAFLAADVTLSGATPTALANVTLAAGTWLVLGRASGENTQGVDAIDLWLSTAAGGAGPALAAAVINLMQINNSWTPSFAAIVTPATSTTYYLNIECGGTCTVKAAGTYITPHVVTGLTAVRLA